MTERPGLNLPSVQKSTFVSGSFEVPEATVKINLRPELTGQLVALLKEMVELGVDPETFRPQFERAAATVADTAGNQEYLPDLLEVVAVAARRGLLTGNDVTQIVRWAEEVAAPIELPPVPPPETRRRWDEARDHLQGWIDAQDHKTAKKLLRQRSVARVTCGDCNSMLAYLVPKGGIEFIVMVFGDDRDFEVGHAVGEYGGYERTRCSRRKHGGRTWVMHADFLRAWLDEGNADVTVHHADKGVGSLRFKKAEAPLTS